MISKDQLARFVRYLNQNYLASNKIRYFSTKRKKQIMKELKEIYSIEPVGAVIHFIGRNKSLFDTKYMIDTKRWFIGGKWITLPRSKPTPPLSLRKARSFSHLDLTTTLPPVSSTRWLLSSFEADQSTFPSAVISLPVFSHDFLSSVSHLLRVE